MRSSKATLTIAALFACLLFGAGKADAAYLYFHTKTLNGSDTEAGQFGSLSPGAVAINQTTGNVYVTGIEYGLVNVFDPNGAFLYAIKGSTTPAGSFSFQEPSGLAVDNSGGPFNGYLYVADQGHNVVDVFDPSGSYKGQLNGSTSPGKEPSLANPTGVAVDGSGSVYIADAGHGRVLKYTPTSGPLDDDDYVSEFKTPGLFNLATIGADAAGNVYVTNFHTHFVKFDADGNSKGAVGPTDGLTRALTVNFSTGEVLYSRYDMITVFDSSNVELTRFSAVGGNSVAVAINESTRRVYVAESGSGSLSIYDAALVAATTTEEPSNVHRTTATLNGTVNTDGAGSTTCEFEYGTDTSYGQTAPCSPAGPFTDTSDHAVSADIAGLTAETTYHYRLVSNGLNGKNYGADKTVTPNAVIGTSTDPAIDVGARSAVLHGSFDPEGEDTRYYFEYGLNTSYGKTIPVPPGVLVPGSAVGLQDASVVLEGLDEAHTYHYRIVATNKYGTSRGEDRSFTTDPLPPAIVQAVSDVRSDSAILEANVDPGGAETSYHFEWGSSACSANPCTAVPVPDAALLDDFQAEDVSRFLGGLTPGTTYYFRVVAVNAAGTVSGPDMSFTTFPKAELGTDDCPNAHARQQTSAAMLLDCRAYELVSAADTGGYNVESGLTPAEQPFGSYPNAEGPSRALYAVQDGGIPGAGSPTNHGPDPYVATRSDSGWTTRYVGVPVDGSLQAGPHGSPLLEASTDLASFAFGGPDICDPCFQDGSTNVPVRLPDGSLVKGMVGSQDPGPANHAGIVRRHFSADGTHFVFGSTAAFEPEGNDNGDVSIYDRDLDAGTTRVVSTLPNGETMTGPGIAQLDISADGSRIVVAQRVSVDAAGNAYWHPYMHVGGSPNTIDLAPGTTSGVLYGGMTRDGSSVFFTTPDALEDDGDTSADLYRADIGESGAELTRISTGAGGTGDTDACDPAATSVGEDWNSVDGASDCSVAAIAGGGGIAVEAGSIYFFSPERLDGISNGTEGAPNLYLAQLGEAPRYVATLESELTGSFGEMSRSLLRETAIIPGPKSVAVDSSNGDLYVLDAGTSTVRKFDASGAPVPFTASAPYVDGNRLTGSPKGAFVFNTHYSGESQVAVDSSGGVTDGYIYVTDSNAPENNAVIDVFDATGAYRGEIAGTGSFDGDCGVAVGQNGDVYAMASGGSGLRRYTPVDGNPANNVSSGSIGVFGSCQVAVDSAGDVYTYSFFADSISKYASSSLTGPDSSTQVVSSGATGIGVDPVTDHLFANFGNLVREYDSTGALLGSFGRGEIARSTGVAGDIDGEVQVADPGGGAVAVFGELVPGPSLETDNPAVIHAVNDAETHYYGDFQVNPSGEHAVLESTLALTDYVTARHVAIYRHEAGSGAIECVSCAPTGLTPTGDAELAPDGLSLSNDGRVFFNSTEELAPRDLNERKDAYEYSDGEVELISTGNSPHDSSLLGISADGTDAYFFTRQRLADEDRNGSLVRIYDARAGGGFPSPPARVPCQASDECHGPGTEQAPPPAIGTFKGTLGNVEPQKSKTCRQGFVKKRGKCVKKRKARAKRNRRASR